MCTLEKPANINIKSNAIFLSFRRYFKYDVYCFYDVMFAFSFFLESVSFILTIQRVCYCDECVAYNVFAWNYLHCCVFKKKLPSYHKPCIQFFCINIVDFGQPLNFIRLLTMIAGLVFVRSSDLVFDLWPGVKQNRVEFEQRVKCNL